METWLVFALILFSSAAVAWAVTESIKKTLQNRFKLVDHLSTAETKKKLWWTPLLVLVSIIVGFGVGASAAAFDWPWAQGALTGSLGGALATFLVGLFKGNIASWLNKTFGNKDDSN